MNARLRSGLASLAVAAVMIAPVTALADYFTSYSYTPNEGSWAIGGIVKFENEVTGGGASWPDAYDGCEPSSGCLTQTINQVFGTTLPRTEALLVGLAYNGVFDRFFGGVPIGGAEAHVVLFVDSTKAAFLLGRPFEGLFPGYTESSVGEWIETVGLIGTPPVSPTVFDTQLTLLAGFADGLRSFDPTGTGFGPRENLWIPLPADQSVAPREFTAVMFTDGTSVGVGFASQRFEQPASEVPAPPSIALLGAGALLAGLAGSGRLRRTRAPSRP